MNPVLAYVLFVLACLAVLSAFPLWDWLRWRRTYGVAMRHRRGVKRGRGHTRREQP